MKVMAQPVGKPCRLRVSALSSVTDVRVMEERL
jgi:hypothetical protein